MQVGRFRSRLRLCLFAQAEFFNQGTVASQVGALHVLKHALAAAYHIDQTPVGVKVFFVLLDVGRDVVDTLGQHSDLRFYRAGVCGAAAIGFKQVFLCFGSQVRHYKVSFI